MNAPQSRKATRRAERRRRLFRSLVSGAIAVIVATTIALVGAGGTYALWAKATPAMSTTTLTAGTASMTVSQPAAFAALAPGRTVSQPFTVANTGDTALSVAVSASSFSGGLASVATVRITDSATCAAGTTKWTRTPSTPAASNTVIGTVAKGASATFCMTVSIDQAAPASTEGGTLASSISFIGTQP
jgi:hypothetical protein